MSSSLNPPPNTVSSTFPSSPDGPNFTPRKEFVKTPSSQSSFALLAFTSNNAIRLSNFPQPFVTALRTALNSIIGLRSFRENAEHKLCEIILIGKPWSNPKSLSTEVVLVQVFVVLLAHGYSFLSQIDYGREHNDRLSLAFSRPNPNPHSPPQPIQPLVPFALSFPSPTTLRVVCSPLHATPAILQSVRGAWPRGVTSEKKVGEGCFEFKLKGYSWFHEDTFPEDALAHILTLLTALDKHAWTLITSISLTPAHARNKDLWIFSGPDHTSSAPNDKGSPVRPATPVLLGSPLKPSVYEPIVDHPHEGSGDSEYSGSGVPDSDAKTHVRNVTDSPVPLAGTTSKRLSKLSKEKEGHGHVRAASDPAALHKPDSGGVLRKKVPTLAPSSFKQTELLAGEEQSQQLRLTDHDIIPGPPPQVVYSSPTSTSPQRTNTTHPHEMALPAIRFPAHGDDVDTGLPPQPQTPMGPPPSHPLVSLPEPAAQHHADEDEDEDLRSSLSGSARDDRTVLAYGAGSTSRPHAHAFTQTPGSEVSTPPLLAPAAFRPRSPSTDGFRDSAYSDATGYSFDVPITWVPAREGGAGERPDDKDKHESNKDDGGGGVLEAVGNVDSNAGAHAEARNRPPPSAFPDHRFSISTTTTGPLPPGAWAATPSSEIGDPVVNMGREGTPRQSAVELPHQISAPDGVSRQSIDSSIRQGTGATASTDGAPRQNTVVSHSPQIVRPELPILDENGRASPGMRRKSEAGVVGVVPDADVPPVPPVKIHQQGHADGDESGSKDENGHAREPERDAGKEKSKEGWVLVSVAPDQTLPPTSTPITSSPSPVAAAAAAQAADAPPIDAGSTLVPLSGSQLIAAADAASSSASPHQLPDTASPTPANSPPSSNTPSPVPARQSEKSTLSRLFSRREKGGGVQKTKAIEAEGDSDKDSKEKGSRFRRRTGGGVLPTIRSGKRISID